MQSYDSKAKDIEEYENELLKRKLELSKKAEKRKKTQSQTIILGIVVIILSITIIAAGAHILIQFAGFVLLIFGIVLTSILIIVEPDPYKNELRDLEGELELSKLEKESISQRAEKMFSNHHSELKRYYDENLNQSKVIFWIGIGCIVFGLVIVIATGIVVIKNLDDELANKLIISGLGAISAILTNFIGVMYLKMHAETTKSLTQFHNRFVNTHHFHFGNFLISQIDNSEKREEALANLALSINQQVTLEQLINQQNQMNPQYQQQQGTQ